MSFLETSQASSHDASDLLSNLSCSHSRLPYHKTAILFLDLFPISFCFLFFSFLIHLFLEAEARSSSLVYIEFDGLNRSLGQSIAWVTFLYTAGNGLATLPALLGVCDGLKIHWRGAPTDPIHSKEVDSVSSISPRFAWLTKPNTRKREDCVTGHDFSTKFNSISIIFSTDGSSVVSPYFDLFRPTSIALLPLFTNERLATSYVDVQIDGPSVNLLQIEPCIPV